MRTRRRPSPAGGPLFPLVTGLALALGLGTAGGLWWFDLPISRLGESWAIRIYWLLLVLALASIATRAAVAREIAAGTLWTGSLLLVLALGSEAAFGFRGIIRAGEGEPQPSFQATSVGPWARVRLPEFEYQGRTEDGRRFVLEVDSRPLELQRGEVKGIGSGVSAHLTDGGAAPYFALATTDGTVLNEGYLEIASRPLEGEFIRVGLLPHRFYLCRVEDEATGSSTETPDALHLRVQRGKIRAFDRDLVKGEIATFEGFEFRFDSGSTWIELEVWSRPRWIFLAASAGIVLIGLALTYQELQRR